jgi:hypothetical protein
MTMSKRFKLLIVGAPRSGTKYLVDVFNFLGLKLGHENAGHEGAVGYNFATEAARRGRNILLKDCDWVAHVIRDPRYVIPSIDANLFDRRTVGFTHYTSEFGGVAGWWVHWNERCEETLKKAKLLGCRTMQFRLEDSEPVVEFLARECGAALPDADYSAHVLKTTNHRCEYTPLEWDDLPMSVRCYAERWYPAATIRKDFGDGRQHADTRTSPQT